MMGQNEDTHEDLAETSGTSKSSPRWSRNKQEQNKQKNNNDKKQVVAEVGGQKRRMRRTQGHEIGRLFCSTILTPLPMTHHPLALC